MHPGAASGRAAGSSRVVRIRQQHLKEIIVVEPARAAGNPGSLWRGSVQVTRPGLAGGVQHDVHAIRTSRILAAAAGSGNDLILGPSCRQKRRRPSRAESRRSRWGANELGRESMSSRLRETRAACLA